MLDLPEQSIVGDSARLLVVTHMSGHNPPALYLAPELGENVLVMCRVLFPLSAIPQLAGLPKSGGIPPPSP